MCLIDAQRLSMIIFEHGDSLPKDVSLDAAVFLSLVEDGRRSYERVLVGVYTAAVFETEALVAAWAVFWRLGFAALLMRVMLVTLAIDVATTQCRLFYWRHLSLGGEP